MAASIFSDTALLEAHREGTRARGVGLHAPASPVTAHIEAEQEYGRVPHSTDADATARLLVGAAMNEALLANYCGGELPDPVDLAAKLVTVVLPAR